MLAFAYVTGGLVAVLVMWCTGNNHAATIGGTLSGGLLMWLWGVS